MLTLFPAAITMIHFWDGEYQKTLGSLKSGTPGIGKYRI